MPHPTGTIAADCRALVADLPDDLVLGARRRNTSPVSPYTAAFASPPVTLRCGLAVPKFAPTADVVAVNGVDWLRLPPTGGTEHFIAFHATAVVEVDIPDRYLPANVLPALSPLVARYGVAQ